MSEYAVEKRETAPKNFFAGDFPTVPETGVAGAEIKEYAPVMVDTENENKIIPVATTKEANAIGISAAAAGKGEPVTYYLTGEFFADALNLEASAAKSINLFEVRRIKQSWQMKYLFTNHEQWAEWFRNYRPCVLFSEVHFSNMKKHS